MNIIYDFTGHHRVWGKRVGRRVIDRQTAELAEIHLIIDGTDGKHIIIRQQGVRPHTGIRTHDAAGRYVKYLQSVGEGAYPQLTADNRQAMDIRKGIACCDIAELVGLGIIAVQAMVFRTHPDIPFGILGKLTHTAPRERIRPV